MKKNNPKVSVLMPVFNGEKFIEESISSVINQTYDNWELIILDDESTDNSWHIIEKYANKYNNIIAINKENDGNSNVAKNISLMCKHAKGEYAFYMSQDDTIDDDCLMKLTQRATELDADIVLPNMILKYNNDKYGTWPCSFPPDNNYDIVLNGKEAFYLAVDFTINGFALIRINLMKDERCDLRYYDSDEYNTRMQFLWANKIAFANTNFYYFQGNPDAITHKFSMRRFQRLKTGIMLYDEYRKVFNERDKIMKLMLQMMHFYIDTTILLYQNIDKMNVSQKNEAKGILREFENKISFSGYRYKVFKKLKNNYERSFALVFYIFGSTLYTIRLYKFIHEYRKSH